MSHELVMGPTEATKLAKLAKARPTTAETPTMRDISGIQALLIAQALKGKWTKQPGERDTEKVKRIWRTMNRILNEPKD